MAPLYLRVFRGSVDGRRYVALAVPTTHDKSIIQCPSVTMHVCMVGWVGDPDRRRRQECLLGFCVKKILVVQRERESGELHWWLLKLQKTNDAWRGVQRKKKMSIPHARSYRCTKKIPVYLESERRGIRDIPVYITYFQLEDRRNYVFARIIDGQSSNSIDQIVDGIGPDWTRPTDRTRARTDGCHRSSKCVQYDHIFQLRTSLAFHLSVS